MDGGTFAALKQLVDLVRCIEPHTIPADAENHVHIVFLLVENFKTLVVDRDVRAVRVVATIAVRDARNQTYTRTNVDFELVVRVPVTEFYRNVYVSVCHSVAFVLDAFRNDVVFHNVLVFRFEEGIGELAVITEADTQTE